MEWTFSIKNDLKNIFRFQELCMKFGKYFKILNRTFKQEKLQVFFEN